MRKKLQNIALCSTTQSFVVRIALRECPIATEFSRKHSKMSKQYVQIVAKFE